MMKMYALSLGGWGVGGGVVLPLEREIACAAIRGFGGLIRHGGWRKADSFAQNPDVV